MLFDVTFEHMHISVSAKILKYLWLRVLVGLFLAGHKLQYNCFKWNLAPRDGLAFDCMVYIAHFRIYPECFTMFSPAAYPRILVIPILNFYTKDLTQKALRFYPYRLSQSSLANTQSAIDQ